MEKRRKNRIILSCRYSDTRFRRKKTGSSHKDSDNKDYAVEFMRFLATEEQLNTIASVKGMPSVAKNSNDEKYAGIENDDLIERSYIDKGEIKNSVKSSVANVGNQFGNGNYENADEAVADLEKRISEQ